MATSTIIDNRLLVRSYTTEEFTVNAGKSGNAPFPESIAIDGYTIIAWKYTGGSTVTMRNSIMMYDLQSTKVLVYNNGTSNATGTMTVQVVYAPSRIL